jgi:hypothetical protein
MHTPFAAKSEDLLHVTTQGEEVKSERVGLDLVSISGSKLRYRWKTSVNSTRLPFHQRFFLRVATSILRLDINGSSLPGPAVKRPASTTL